MAVSVYIIGTGARTPLGLNARSSAAALRAGVSSLGEHPFMLDQVGDAMPGALDSLLDPAIFGVDRFLPLVKSALLEACAPLERISTQPPLSLPVYLALPEVRPGFSKHDADTIRDALASTDSLPVNISEVKILSEGHAAGLAAFAAAMEHINTGHIKAALVGGVDSYFHPDTMEWLDGNRQLSGSVSRSAFVPGEGAGFCMLASAAFSEELGLDQFVRVFEASFGRENKLIKTSDICLGEGLTTTIKKSIERLEPSQKKINDIVCDINGERYRGEEWGFVCLRLPQYFDAPTAYLSPADYWGDMGAASGPLFAMLACQAAECGYASGPRTLLWASSEGGLRGAVLLEAIGKT